MKKQVSTITLALAALTGLGGFAQTAKPVIPCATYEAMETRFAQDPSARVAFEKAQQQIQEAGKATANAARPASAFEYTVPVVFHVLHQGGPENVSDAACFAALDQVNKDYARMSQDTSSIFAPFKSLYVASDIKFMPAKKDPQGNCINGVVHHYDAKTKWSQGTAATQNSYWPYTWDPTRYLNIYIVADIVPQGTVTGGGIIVGYTYIPGTWPTGNPHDAIVYRSTFLGTNFPNPDSRSLSHEIGHWLSLAHTFGNTNNPGVVCGDDGISDTPPTKGNFATCPAASTNTNFTCASPNPTNSNSYYQNVENIMDYASCPKNFTQGQSTNMRNLLASSISNRQNLWSASNLVFTGINNTIPCAPVADFLSINGSYTVCAGQSLTMKDFSYNGTITSYAWSVDNSATIVAPTASQTAINFQLVGVSNVTLVVSNSQGNSTKVRTVYVIDGTPAVTGPNFESFEQGLPPYWEIGNEQNDASTWVNTNMASYDQSYSYYIDGANMPPNTADYIQTPIMDVKNNSGNVFEFAYAYRKYSASTTDVLKIQASRDCGGSWEDIFTLSANVMSSGSGGTGTDPYFPNTQEEWKTYVVSSHPKWLNYINSTSVLVRFRFETGNVGYGNNVFVDAVNFYSPNGVNELTQKYGLRMQPNPANDETNVILNLNDAAKVSVSVNDLLGRRVQEVAETAYSAGEYQIAVPLTNLQPGAYIVNISVNGAVMTKKLIVE